MRYTRPRGSQFALWPLFVLAAAICGQIGLTGAQDQFGDEEQQPAENVPKNEEMNPLPTGKWNQFKGFYTPRPLPSNAHFTFASVWASWSAWSYCTQNIQIRVRACNTVRGFSCLGPNREVRPCEHSTLPPNRVRQFQVAPQNTGIDAQYEAEDPWADDRKEALRQLYSDYEGPKQKEEELKEVKKAENQMNLEPIKLKGIGPPGIRPEAFGSKLVGRKEIIEMKKEGKVEGDSLEEMNLGELAEKLEVKEPKELAEKLSELETVDADTEEIMPKATTTTMQTTTMALESTKRVKSAAIRPAQYFNKGIQQQRPKSRPALPFTTTSPQPPTRTTMTEPRHRPEQNGQKGEGESRPRSQAIKQKEGGRRRSGEMEAKAAILVTPKSAVAEDTAKALEWIMTNMSKSIETATALKSRSKSEETEIGAKTALHSGESMLESREGNSGENEPKNGTTKTTLAIGPKLRAKGGNRAMAVNSYRKAKSGERENNGRGDIRMRHRQRLIKELAKAQEAKQRQIEKSREQIEQQNGGNENEGEMERELARLKAEMRAMEAVLARMKADARENANPNNEGPQWGEIIREKEEEEEASTTQNNPIVVFPSKREKKIMEESATKSAEENKKEQNVESGEITARILPAIKRRIVPQKKTMPVPKTTTIRPTTAQSLILTEQPESIWLAGSAPKAGAAVWSGWGQWGECICGKQMRSRSCLFEDGTFHPQGCIGRSYESRQCAISTENCPTTIPPIPPSKQKTAGNDRRQQNSANLRRTALSIANPVGGDVQRENEGKRRRMRFWWKK